MVLSLYTPNVYTFSFNIQACRPQYDHKYGMNKLLHQSNVSAQRPDRVPITLYIYFYEMVAAI